MWNNNANQILKEKRLIAKQGGGEARTKKQHDSGKLTVWERINVLFDAGTFTEINSMVQACNRDDCMPCEHHFGDGVVTGYGTVNGRIVFVAAEDFTVNGGTLGEAHARKICNIMDMALEMRAPFLMLNDSGGARIEEGVRSLNGYSGVFYRNTKMSGIVPQIAVIMGPCAGGACYSPAICDFIFMVDNTSQMFITGPQVIKAVTGEQVSVNELGGSKVHAQTSGVAHFTYQNDTLCLQGVRTLLGYLPQNNEEKAPLHLGKITDQSQMLENIVPDNSRKAYDMREVVKAITDDTSFFEAHTEFARNILVGFARMEGETVGIVANQPNFMGGSLDVNASDKAARFVRFCDAFEIPLVTLVDVPAFLPGKQQEDMGIIRHGAKMLYAYSEATVPKVTVILRKAYGGAYIAMNSKGMGADMVFAWPIAEMAVMGEEGAVNILYRKQLSQAENPVAERARLTEEYRQKFVNPQISAANGYVDEVILPEETRSRIVSALMLLQTKKKTPLRKKHGNIPL